jgi:hypothetical protein
MEHRSGYNVGRRPRRRMQRAATITALVAAVILVGALWGVVGCGSGEETSTTASATTSGTVASTTSTSGGSSGSVTSSTIPSPPTHPDTTASSSTTTTEALSSAETRLPNGNIRAMGFISEVWESGGVRHLSIDYAEMLTGEEAVAAAIEAGEIAPGEDLPNDYFISNVNPQFREFTVASDVSITTATYLGGGPDDPQPVTWAEFKSFWDAIPPAGAEHLHVVPWWIERDGDEIVSIAEQYLP